MDHHKFVVSGAVVLMYVNGKLSNVKLEVSKPDDIRQFIMSPNMSAEMVEKKMNELRTTGSCEFDD